MTFKFDKLYRLGAWGAAACMVAICALIALQVTFRLVDALLVLVGLGRLGISITGVSEMASYLLVGATFLGLAYTFVHHAHIRVTLLISRLPSAIRVWFEVFGLIVAVLDGIALRMLGVPLVLAMVILAFVTNYIPNIGFVIGLLPPTILALVANGPVSASPSPTTAATTRSGLSKAAP